MLLISSLVLFISYLFIAFDRIPKTTIAMLGAAIMLILSKAPAEKVFAHIDFAVIFLLISMMIIVNITNRSGVFKWLGIELIKFAKGNPKYLLVYLATFTAVLSAFLDNVTTVVIVLPITFSLAKQLKISPIPFLITEIIASNIGGTATLIGDPPNIIIATAAGLTFMDFIREITPIVLLIFVISTATLLLLFRKDLTAPPELMDQLRRLDNSQTLKDKPLLLRSLTTLVLVIVGFMLHGVLHLDPYVIALLGASILMLFESPKQVMHEVEWTTIFFFIGLFIIIGSFAESGGIKLLADQLLLLTHGQLETTALAILWASGGLSAIIDNIPYTVTMVPLIKELQPFMNVYPLWWSLSLGACLGGNATIIGAAANVIVAEAAEAQGFKISFFEYMKYGLIVTLISLTISTVFLLGRFF